MVDNSEQIRTPKVLHFYYKRLKMFQNLINTTWFYLFVIEILFTLAGIIHILFTPEKIKKWKKEIRKIILKPLHLKLIVVILFVDI